MSLDVWPALPLHIQGVISETSVDDIASKLRYSNRICRIGLKCKNLQSEIVWAAMQVPFPELKALLLSTSDIDMDHMVPVLPDSFLGGSAPRLQFLTLIAIPFPGLANLLSSTTHLTSLALHNIPHSGYISPDAMVTCLSMLTNLERLRLEFESPRSCPDQENRRSPPPTRSILPALKSFLFKGVYEYLEDLVSQIDSPRLYQLSITFFNDIDYSFPKLNQFISRTPTLGAYTQAHLIFHRREALVRLRHFQSERPRDSMVGVKILCQVSD
jgi:hypothetical protein